MHSASRTSRYGIALLSTLALWACDSGSPVAGPEPEPAGSFDSFEASVVSQAKAAGIDPLVPAPEVPLQRSNGNRQFVFVQGSVGDAAVEAVIGSAGGVLNLGNHWLLVPRNAVRGSVRFRMTPISDGTFHVDLTATLVRSSAEIENDVGRAGFRFPVYLAFHFGNQGTIDPAALQVAWRNDGTLITQQTFIYEQEWAVGVLRHFSGYVLVAN